MKRKIVTVHEESLRQPSKEVLKIDKKVKAVIADLIDTLKSQKDPEGIGLAAPQIGKNIQMFVVNYDGLKRVMISPKVLKTVTVAKKKKHKNHKILEGCLSLPHYYSPVDRANLIRVEYLDENGIKKQETFKGFKAHVVQHEIDHLNGTIFIDHVLVQKKPLYKFHGEDYEEVELELV